MICISICLLDIPNILFLHSLFPLLQSFLKNYDRLYTKNPLRMLRDLARDTCFVKEIWVDGHHKNYQNFPYFELTKEAKQYLNSFK